MRIALPLGRRLFLLCVFLFTLAALLPLRIALDRLGLDERGLSAREVAGTLWFGRLTEARVRDFALGDLEADLAFLPLLIGEARVELRGDRLRGTIIQSSNEAGAADLTGRLGPESFPGSLPLNAIELADASARFRNGVCESAEGGVRVEPRPGLARAINLGQLQGSIRCDGEALLVPLASGSGRERVDLRLFGDGRYRASLIVQAGDPLASAALAAAGFIATAEGMTMTTEGSL